MASAATEMSEPMRLHLPAILQNPTNRSVRQVAAHNAQQREKAAAKREHREAEAAAHGGRGKRYVRRKDNATFAANPHIVQPTKGDFTPPVPLHHRRVQTSFPPSVVPRSIEAPSSQPVVKDPFSQDSHHGAFSTSLKGTRALLRKRGRRAEVVVGNVERELRGWLAGEGWDLQHEDDALDWRVVGGELVEYTSVDADPSASASASTSPPTNVSRRMPAQHQIRVRLPALPVENGRVASILELSRSPAHLTWAISEGFERMVVHLVARYYEVISWSEDHLTADDQPVRLTHIILPSLAQAKAPPVGHSLITPDVTDISDLSAPSSSDRDTDSSTDAETDSDAGTEVGYSLDTEDEAGLGDTSIATVTAHEIVNVTEEVANLDINPLERIPSNTSSMYASSEGGSEFGLGDSTLLPPPPANGGWTAISYPDAESDFGDVNDVPFPRRLGGLEANPVILGRVGPRGWQEKPTFFEYLYGA